MVKLDKMILDSDGKFVTVEFIKKDGSLRTINGRLGVKKYLKGGVSKLDPKEFITIYSMADKGYRAINRDTILSVTVEGYTVTKNGGK